MCARIAVFYQARRVSGHMCVLGLHNTHIWSLTMWPVKTLQCFTVFLHQARRVSGHICVLGLQCFTRPGE